MKCRLLYLHPDVNSGKLERLDALHREYVGYVRICVQEMLDRGRYSLSLGELKSFFPPSEKLTSQIQKSAQRPANQMVSTWAKAVYARKMKPTITNLWREGIGTVHTMKPRKAS